MAGHLALLEQQYSTGKLADYPLFPSGQMTGGRRTLKTAVCRVEQATAKPLHRRTLLVWFHEAERLAGIEQVPGRGWYGLRRVSVDGARTAGISDDGLQAFGGWNSIHQPLTVYAEQHSELDRREAARMRAKNRGHAEEA